MGLFGLCKKKEEKEMVLKVEEAVKLLQKVRL